MSDKATVTSKKLSPPGGVYSHAVRIPSGRGLLFISGLTARDASGKVVAPRDIKGQTREVLENMRRSWTRSVRHSRTSSRSLSTSVT